MAGIDYNPEILRDYAARLYARATLVTIAYCLGGVLLVVVLGTLALAARGGVSGGELLFLALIGGALGVMAGAARAFRLKLEAQLVLCQVQIAQSSMETAYMIAAQAQRPAPGWTPAPPHIPSPGATQPR